MAFFKRKKSEPERGDDRAFEIEQRETTNTYVGDTHLIQQLAPESFDVDKEGGWIKIGDEYCRTLYISAFPVEIEDNWLRDIYRYPDPLNISLFITQLDTGDMVKDLNGDIARLEVDLAELESEGRPPDHRRERVLEDMKELRRLIGSERTKPYDLSMPITVRAKSLPELDRITEGLERRLGVGAKTDKAKDRHKDGFFSTIPTLQNLIKSKRSVKKIHTQGLMAFMPFVASELNHGRGTLFGLNASTRSAVIVNRFDPSRVNNWNMAILGQSGSGKSVSGKIDAIHWIMKGVPAIFIDPQHEYRRIALAFGGVSLTLGAESRDKINPFDFSYMIPETWQELQESGDNPLAVKIRSLMTLVVTLLRSQAGEQGIQDLDAKKNMIEYCLRQTYAQLGYHVNRPDLLIGAQSNAMPIFSDFARTLDAFAQTNRDPRFQTAINSLRDALRLFHGSGSYAGLYDHHTNVDMRSRVIVFDISRLQDTDQDGPVMHMIIDFIRGHFTARQAESGQKRLLVVDEAQKLMDKPESAAFLADIVSTARKFGIGFTFLTQDVETLLKNPRDGSVNPLGKKLLNNCPTVILMQQRSSAIEAVQDVFGLTPHEAASLASADKGEGLIMVGERERAWVNMRDILAPSLMNLTTTDPTDLARLAAERNARLAQGQGQAQPQQLPQPPRQIGPGVPPSPQGPPPPPSSQDTGGQPSAPW